jgi:hypothetical protein
MKTWAWSLLCGTFFCTSLGLVLAYRTKPAKNPDSTAKGEYETDFDYWNAKSRSENDIESRRRLKSLYQINLLYAADHDSREMSFDALTRLRFYVIEEYTNPEDANVWFSPLCPPGMRRRTSLGYMFYEPQAKLKDDLLNQASNRLELFELDRSSYPVIIDGWVDALKGDKNGPANVNVLTYDGQVKSVTAAKTFNRWVPGPLGEVER